MFNYRFLIKIITVGMASLFMITGCATGIGLMPSASTGSEGSSGDGGGLPGAPTTTGVSTSGSTSGLINSQNFTVFLTTSPVNFHGSSQGSRYGVSDPFLETAMDAVIGAGSGD